MGSACGKSSHPTEEPAPAVQAVHSTQDTAVTAKPDTANGSSQPVRERATSVPGEFAQEGLLPVDQAFSQTDMDAPKPRKMSAQTQPSQAPSLPVGTQGKKRFRKRSVNITTLPDDQLAVVDRIFDDLDSDQTGYISRQAVARVLKQHYRPSEMELQEVLKWMDSSGAGSVTFDEYMVAMASVMSTAGLNENNDIDTARAALSKEMQRLSAVDEAEDNGTVRAVMEASPENLKNAETVIGAENLLQMKMRFKSLDTESKGFLNKDEIRELIKLTYVAPEENINTFMKFFDGSCKEQGITRGEFKHGLTLLYGDFTFVLNANQRMVNGEVIQ